MTTLYTIGHSTRPIQDLTRLLTLNGIARLVDVRSYPGSRKNPQFSNYDGGLQAAIEEAGLAYTWLPDLGGRRKQQCPRGESACGGWESDSFRNYADYAYADPGFERGLAELLALADQDRVAYMCSEMSPMMCHRRLISDYLVERGHDVQHIYSSDKTFTTIKTYTHVPGHKGPMPTGVTHGDMLKLAYPLP